MRYFSAVILSLLLVWVQAGCSGGRCAAVSTFETDYDSDCVADSEDNCLVAGNPDQGYNPEQFDGDEDGVGVPCDPDDQDATSVGSFLQTPPIDGTKYLKVEGDCSRSLPRYIHRYKSQQMLQHCFVYSTDDSLLTLQCKDHEQECLQDYVVTKR